MTYQTILVYLHSEERAANIIEAAVTLAKQNENTHLTGVYIVPGVPIYPGIAINVSSEIDEIHHRQHADQANKLQKLFDEICAREAISTEWRVEKTNAAQVAGALVDQSRSSDIVVIGQQDESALTFDQEGLPGQLVVESGGPVLLIPHSGTFKTIGTNVLLAWNSSRESARAAFDALPLLKRAEKVSILCINPPNTEASLKTILGTEIAASLARHGVNAEVVKDFASDVSVGDELLSRAFAHECDLIVMGAYGHSRIREMVFGGATKYVLDHMTMPVLMSH